MNKSDYPSLHEYAAALERELAEARAERDAAMSLVEASTREGVLAEAMHRAEQAEAEAATLRRMLDIAAEEIAEDRSVWGNMDASPPFKFIEADEVLADLRARAEEGSDDADQ
jgi:hypothetical protein